MQFTRGRASQSRHLGISAVCVVALAVPAISSGQLAGTGTIQGVIQDQTGAHIPNAVVTLTEVATHVVRTVKADDRGTYVFPNITVGTYDVAVTASGFQTFVKTGNVLEVGSNIAIDASLTVGAETDRIEVQADGLALQTEDATFKQTIDQQQVTEIPLASSGRRITDLLNISGGTASAPGGDFTGSKYSYAVVSVSIAGGNGNTTAWRLDGGDNNDYMANGNLPFPFPDAVSQFSVESTALGAQESQHAGGLVNVVTRSGTNEFHGSAFEFVRNNLVNATSFYSTKKDSLHQHQFGGTFGGPIIRNKLFAFAGYQRLQTHQTAANTMAYVPTAANLAGDFSVTDPAPGTAISGVSCRTSTVQLYDPKTGAALPGNKYATAPTWDPAALKLISYLPKPTDACGTVTYAVPSNVSDNQFVTRVDYNISAKHNFYGRYLLDGYQAPSYFFPTNILVTTASGSFQRVQTLSLGENYTISPRIVNSAHLTLSRRRNNRGYSQDAINATALGISVDQPIPNGLYVQVTNKFTTGGSTASAAHFNDNSLSFNDDVTMLLGKHSLVFGGEIVRNQLNIANGYSANGGFSFNGAYSGNGPSGGNLVGDANLDLLRGTMNTFTQSKQQQNALRGWIPSLYVQDTFHATKDLTLIGGIRWSPMFMPTDVFNRGNVFNRSAFLANQVSSVYPNAPAGVFFYGDSGVPRAFTENSPWQFAPNVALAYDPFGNGKTVFRAGMAYTYDPVNFFTGQRVNQNAPFATAINQTTSTYINFDNPWSSPGGITTSPYPQPSVPTPSQAVFYNGAQYIFLPQHFHPAVTLQWTASVQQQFGHGYQFQLDYIGNKTNNLPYGIPLSPANFVPGAWGAGGTGCSGVVVQAGVGAAGAAGTPCSTVGNQAQRYALTVANPTSGPRIGGGGSGSLVAGDDAYANYNGLIVTLQHRLSSSFSLLANYTWSKCLNIADANGDINFTGLESPVNNIGLDYGPCGSDVTNNFNTVLVTKSDFHVGNRMEALLVNGWEFAPLFHVTSGTPINVTAGQDNSLTSVNNDRPSLVPGQPIYLKTAFRSAQGAANRQYLNPAAFQQTWQAAGCAASPTPNPLNCPAGFGHYGTISRNAFRGRPAVQFDAQVSRIFPIHDRINLTARIEAFNVLNHPNFSNPGTTITSGTFGQISGTNNSPRQFQGSVKVNF